MSDTNEKHADIWTNLSALGEGLSSLVGDAYWWACVFDLLTGNKYKKTKLGVSYEALIFGLLIAIVTACGAANCHRILDTNHQPPTSKPPKNDIDLEQSEAPKIKKPLSVIQIISLIGDFFAHSADRADPGGLLAFLIFKLVLGSTPDWMKILVQTGIFIIAMLGSVSSVRTCKNTMEKKNNGVKIVKSDHEQNKTADGWTNAGAVIGGGSVFIANLVWLTYCFDLFTGLKSEDIEGTSYGGALFGLTLSFLASLSITVLRRHLDVSHQHSHIIEEPKALAEVETNLSLNADPTVLSQEFKPEINAKSPPEQAHLNKLQYAMLFLSFVARVGEIVGALSIIVKILADTLSKNEQRIVLGAMTFCGLFASYSTIRTLKKNLEEKTANTPEDEKPLLQSYQPQQ